MAPSLLHLIASSILAKMLQIPRIHRDSTHLIYKWKQGFSTVNCSGALYCSRTAAVVTVTPTRSSRTTRKGAPWRRRRRNSASTKTLLIGGDWWRRNRAPRRLECNGGALQLAGFLQGLENLECTRVLFSEFDQLALKSFEFVNVSLSSSL